MKEETKKFITQCINQHRSDDLYRAQCAFRHCTPEGMNEEYGNSGETRQQIIAGYKAREQKCDVAIKELLEEKAK